MAFLSKAPKTECECLCAWAHALVQPKALYVRWNQFIWMASVCIQIVFFLFRRYCLRESVCRVSVWIIEKHLIYESSNKYDMCLFDPVVLGTNRVDESLPALLGEAECAWLKLRRWEDFRRESLCTNWLVAKKALEIKLGNIYCMSLAVCNLAGSDIVMVL